MVIDGHNYFILKSLHSKGASAVYDTYLEISDLSGKVICDKSLPYLKAFVQYPGDLCEGIIRNRNYEPISLMPWGSGYIEMLTRIAAWYLDNDAKDIGILWAKKAADIYRYFAPGLDGERETEIFRDTVAHVMIWECQQYFEQSAYEKFNFDWEFERINGRGDRVYLNDNGVII